MTQIEQILAELDRRIAIYDAQRKKTEPKTFDRGSISGRKVALEEFKVFVQSLLTEPTNEDLEQAARDYRDKTEFQYPNQLQPAYEGFKVGAQWQKEQIMKDAVEGIVQEDGNFIKFSDDTYIDLNPSMGAKPMFELKDGTKVQVFILPSDNKND